MDQCPHDVLVLVSEKTKRVRCIHCHLTLSPEELGQGYCPECAAERGVRHREFEEVEEPLDKTVRFQCERCSLLIERDEEGSNLDR
jgi:predicted RNA-binding Zn-ribbon protein involved in translation (DUF1610 family)